MMNDKKVVEQVKQLRKYVDILLLDIDAWLANVKVLGNQCAITDRQLEGIIDVGVNKVGKTLKKVSKSYEEQFKY